MSDHEVADYEVALIEYPEGAEVRGSLRILGHSFDPDLIETVRQRLIQEGHRSLARLGGHLRPAEDDES